jgi:aryl-alcohol dehydrogenase
VLNVMKPDSGSSIAIFGAGAVGLAAVMAAKVAGCTTIVVVDLRTSRLELSRELGATHIVDGSKDDALEAIRSHTAGGSDFSLEATGSPQALRAAIDCLAPTGIAGVIGAPAFGTEASFDVNHLLTGGRVIRGIVEGESIPTKFLPRLIELWQRGEFPVERMMAFYDFDQIDQAAHDAETGRVIKPVLRIS